MKSTIPLHHGMHIPYHDIGPRHRSPRLALVAGVNGQEWNGLFVLARLANFLNEIDAGERPGQRLLERIVIIPTANAMEYGDLQAPHGEPIHIHTITEVILPLTRQAYYRVEIDTPTPNIEEMPQLRLYTPNDDERATACLFGLPAVIERPTHAITSLTRAWQEWGGENFVIKTSQAGHLQPTHCEILFRALVGFLDRTGMVDGLALSEEENDLHYFSRDQIFTMASEHTGLFVSPLEVGRWIQAGDHIGYICDPFTGDIRTEVRAPVPGLVATLRRQPMLFKSDLITRILIPKPRKR